MNLLIIFTAKYLYLVSVGISMIYFFLASSDIKKGAIVLSLFTLPGTFIAGKILGYFIYSPRPFVVENVAPLIKHAADNGFPSDHTLLAMAVAAIISVYDRRLGMVLFILGLTVGFARILSKIHHPVDILGSIFISYVITYSFWYFLRKFQIINKNKIVKF